MAVSPVLADSSYYIRLMREGRDPVRELMIASATRDLAICGVIRVEVGRAIRQVERLRKFQNIWNVMINVPTDNRLWMDVESTAWELDRNGKFLPLPDLIIGCCAKRLGAVVLTFDQHFQQIPGVRSVQQLDY